MTASCDDSQVSTQPCDAMQPTDQRPFWSRIGLKGPVSEAEACWCFQTGELLGDVFITLCRRGPHQWQGAGRILHAVGCSHARYATHSCIHHLQLTMHCLKILSFWPPTPTVFPAWAVACKAVHAYTYYLLPNAVLVYVPYPQMTSCLVTDLPANAAATRPWPDVGKQFLFIKGTACCLAL